MLNLGKEGFTGNITLKMFFQMALMSWRILVRQKLSYFIIAIPNLFVLTYYYHYSYSYSYYNFYYYHYYIYYYYHYYYWFIAIIVIIIIAFSFVKVIPFYFISFCFLWLILLWFLSACHVWRVCAPRNVFCFLLMIYILYLHCSYNSSIIFLLSFSLLFSLSSSFSFWF